MGVPGLRLGHCPCVSPRRADVLRPRGAVERDRRGARRLVPQAGAVRSPGDEPSALIRLSAGTASGARVGTAPRGARLSLWGVMKPTPPPLPLWVPPDAATAGTSPRGPPGPRPL